MVEGRACKCFQHSANAAQRRRREKMWGSFHRLRTSVTFISRWKNFLKEVITATACPIFFQHLTSTIFMDMVRQEFPVVETGPQRQEEQALSYEEKNALRYAAGYVPRHLKKRLQKSAHPMNQELTLCLRSSSGR